MKHGRQGSHQIVYVMYVFIGPSSFGYNITKKINCGKIILVITIFGGLMCLCLVCNCFKMMFGNTYNLYECCKVVIFCSCQKIFVMAMMW